MKNTVLHCENIIKSYGSGRRRTEVLHGISLSLQKGIFYSLIGKSGSGKSTLLDQKTSGRVLDFLLELKREYQPAILMVTHDLDMARSAEVVFHMEDGTIWGDGNAWENGNASESGNTWESKNTLGGGR